MLVSLTRIGASRQGFAKTLAIAGTDAASVAGALRPDTLGGIAVEASADVPCRLAVRTPPLWLGTRPARDEEFRRLGSVVGGLAEAARRAGGALVAPGVVVGGGVPLLEGDPTSSKSSRRWSRRWPATSFAPTCPR